MSRAILDSAEFEDSMERSFIYWLQNELTQVEIAGETFPIEVVCAMPYEYFMKQRNSKIMLDVCFTDVNTEAFMLGSEIPYDSSGTESALSYTNLLYRYLLGININIYAGSSGSRARVDGQLRNLFEGLRRGYKTCPVYEWVSDTSATSAFTTGSFINVFNNRDVRTMHDQDTMNNDFLSNWTIDAKCNYVYDTTTYLATSFDLTLTIENPN